MSDYEPHHSEERPMAENADPVSRADYSALVYVIYDTDTGKYACQTIDGTWEWTRFPRVRTEWSDPHAADLVRRSIFGEYTFASVQKDVSARRSRRD